MPDVQTMFYHGVRENIRRVLKALGPDRIEKGLTAFEDGASNWSQCFFARALKGEVDLAASRRDQTLVICEILGDPTYKLKVPVKMIWHTFDQMGAKNYRGVALQLTREDMRKFINDVLDESRPAEVMQLLRSINYDKVEDREFSCETT